METWCAPLVQRGHILWTIYVFTNFTGGEISRLYQEVSVVVLGRRTIFGLMTTCHVVIDLSILYTQYLYFSDFVMASKLQV